jgi:single-strand DNA-binding protein
MKSVNKVVLLGNVSSDPNLTATTAGEAVCSFGVATTRVWKDEAGQKQATAEFHHVVARGRLAEFCEQYLKKGKPLYVEGYLQTRRWESPVGKRHVRTEIVAEDLVLLGASNAAE